MQTTPPAERDDFLVSFSHQRHVLLRRASEVLGREARDANNSDSREGLSQMLLAALELLKVAEAELIDERRERDKQQNRLERLAAHCQSLFRRAPAALFVTTSDTTIRDVSDAGADLLKRTATELEGQQLRALIPRNQRDRFDKELKQVLDLPSVAAWSFTIERRSDVPVVVKASVRVEEDPGISARGLYWHIQPLEAAPI